MLFNYEKPQDVRDNKSKEFKNLFEQRKHNIYLGLFIIFFLGFVVVMLVGCWKFLEQSN
jgi:hypothetical protein